MREVRMIQMLDVNHRHQGKKGRSKLSSTSTLKKKPEAAFQGDFEGETAWKWFWL